jgi:hypothetical protein
MGASLTISVNVNSVDLRSFFVVVLVLNKEMETCLALYHFPKFQHYEYLPIENRERKILLSFLFWKCSSPGWVV